MASDPDPLTGPWTDPDLSVGSPTGSGPRTGTSASSRTGPSASPDPGPRTDLGPRTDPDLASLAARQAGLVDIRQCRAAGVTDRRVSGLVRRREWVRVTRGVYDTVRRPLRDRPWDARRRRAAWAALLAFGPEAVAVGACALVLLGVQGLPGGLAPQAALPGASNRRHRDGVLLRQFDHGLATVEREGRRVASPVWALAQAVPELPRPNALAVLDSALHRGLLDGAGLDEARDLARGRRGVASRWPLWTWADARAESPLESFGRLDCLDAGVPPHTLQLPVRDDADRVVARADMAWRQRTGRWLVAEMDGHEFHSDPAAVYADRRRQNLLTSTGAVDVLRFTYRDVPGAGTVVRRILVR